MIMRKKAQSTVELTFTLIVICMLAYGMVRVFRWAGMDLAERRWSHESTIITGNDVEKQLSPDFYRSKRINGWVRQ